MFQNTDGISKHRLSPYTSTIYITNSTFYLMFPVPGNLIFVLKSFKCSALHATVRQYIQFIHKSID